MFQILRLWRLFWISLSFLLLPLTSFRLFCVILVLCAIPSSSTQNIKSSPSVMVNNVLLPPSISKWLFYKEVDLQMTSELSFVTIKKKFVSWRIQPLKGGYLKIIFLWSKSHCTRRRRSTTLQWLCFTIPLRITYPVRQFTDSSFHESGQPVSAASTHNGQPIYSVLVP